jgi:serine/threonine protein kinase
VSEEIGDYVLLEQVGAGSQSTVYRARSRDRAGRIVAVKRLHVDAPEDAVLRLQREAEVLASLSHPAIMPLLDVVPDPQGGVALVVPYAPGGTLEQQLASRGALPWAEVADLGARLASALAAAHGAGVLHRDVKPANVLLGVENEPRLSDFGTVVLQDHGHLLDDGVVIGTAEYLDPAMVVDRADPGPRSDLYSLAVLLFRALSGQLPFAGGSPAATVAAADRGVHAPLGQLTDAPGDMVAAIERSMARDPNQRFGAVQQLGVVLEGLARAADRDRMSDLVGRLGDGPDLPTRSGSVLPARATGSASPEAGSPEFAASPPPSADPPPPPAVSGGDSGTRLFGPRPSSVPELPGERARPTWAVPVIVALLLVPLVVVGVLWWTGRGADIVDPPGQPTAREAAPRCDGVQPPDGEGDVLDADVDGRGCSLPLRVTRESIDGQPSTVLTLPPDAGDLAGRYVVATADDQVVVGDWDCNGIDTPGVYRPATGETFLYDGYGTLAPTSGPTLEPNAGAAVVTTAAGCDELVTIPTSSAAGATAG